MARLRAEAHREVVRPADGEVRAALSALMHHPAFDASERNRRFLSYVVEETLAGRADRIKAYTIALAAFDRGDDFDPLTDPIVRIEAGRLRRSLEHYYLTAGATSTVRIDIPKGSYVAVFSYALPANEVPHPHAPVDLPTPDAPASSPAAATAKEQRGRWATVVALLSAAAIVLFVGIWFGVQHFWPPASASLGPSILVLPFEDASGDPTQQYVSRGLTYEVIADLTRFDHLFVYGPETSFNGDAAAISADYVLKGTVRPAGDRLQVSTILMDTRSGRYVWAGSDDRELTASSLIAVQTDTAAEVARAIAQPYGVIFRRTAEEIAGKPAKDLTSYECVVRFQMYWRNYDVAQYGDLVSCMERTLKSDPSYARAYSSLALLYVDSYRFGYGPKLSFDPVERALELARTAIRLEPKASDGYLALSVALWFSHDTQGGIDAAKQGLALNPNNTNLIAELGIRYALLADWEQSKPLLDQLFKHNPAAPAGYRRGRFLYHYMHGDYEAALHEMLAAEAPLNLYDYLFRAVTYAQLRDKEKAAEMVAEIVRIDPQYGQHIAADFAKRNAAPIIIQALVDGLNKAGLPATTEINGDY